MNCDAFLQWMKTHTDRGMPENQEVIDHLESCPACRQLFALDACLEAGIQQAFTPHHLPAGLAETIDVCVDRYAGIHQKPESSGNDPLLSTETEQSDLRKTPPGKKGL